MNIVDCGGMPQRFSVIEGRWAVARLGPEESVPPWASSSNTFTSITRTPHELSIVCPVDDVPHHVQAEHSWALLQVHGPLLFDQIGILRSFTSPLADAGIAVLAISTFDTDYILVKAERLASACDVLKAAGHALDGEAPR